MGLPAVQHQSRGNSNEHKDAQRSNNRGGTAGSTTELLDTEVVDDSEDVFKIPDDEEVCFSGSPSWQLHALL